MRDKDCDYRFTHSMDHMNKKHLPGYLLAAMLLLFIGPFAIQSSTSSGKALSNAFMPPVDEAAPKITLEELKESELRFEDLVDAIRHNPQKISPLPLDRIDTETLWLARCIYSETKRPDEMELVAWVVRNRVETEYRGRDSYRDVVLDPYQFSAFNPNGEKRWFYSDLDPSAEIHGWQKALAIAYVVRQAAPTYRPFPIKTRHFYSERSMVGNPHPEWALGRTPVLPQRDFILDERRFRFYADVS
jgi:hypothetical protein